MANLGNRAHTKENFMLKQLIAGSTGVLFGLALSSPAFASNERKDYQHPFCQLTQAQGCYWMENSSGFDCWVPATWVNSFEECFSMDSCDGGLGYSSGGCYKWSDCSDCDRYFWQPVGAP
jgi:hypothetical protein